MNRTQKLLAPLLLITTFLVPLTAAPVAGAAEKCAGIDTAIIKCGGSKNAKDLKNNGVWQLLIIVLNILTAGVGIVAVGAITYAAILYASAGDKSQQVQEAINMIINTVIGIVAFALMYAFLQFIIPGGVFN